MPIGLKPLNAHPEHAERMDRKQTRLLVWTGFGLMLFIILLLLFYINTLEHSPRAAAPGPQAQSEPAAKPPAAVSAKPAAAVQTVAERRFEPPAETAMPEGPMGDMIRQGERIFLNTQANAKAFTGNALNCVNCHLDTGRLADSAPLWGAYTMYPTYRSKTKHVDDFEERLRGCFMYSMNGKAPPQGDDVLLALEVYSYWMAKGAPVGEKLPGAGYLKLTKPAEAPDIARGKTLYASHCALCHGAEGEGQRSGTTQVFPPLWGAQSFNWGAGMANINNAAGFIKANMPLGLGGSLSDQEAWDVAIFMDSHERPQDPRFTGDVAGTREQFHNTPNSLYGTRVDGQLLGQGISD